MTAAFMFDPDATYDVKKDDQVIPFWRIQNRRVYAYLEHDPRRDWSGAIGTLVLCPPPRLIDHDGHALAFIDGDKVRCVDGRDFLLIRARQ